MTSERVALHVMAVLEDGPSAELMRHAAEEMGDHFSLATDLTEGLSRAAAESPDVVFVDVSMGHNAGLAVVHHVRAVAPTVTVYALTRPEALTLGTQAVALGGTGLLMLPLSGDEFLTALTDVRTRIAERLERIQLEQEASASRRGASLSAVVAELAESSSRREAAERLAQLLEQEVSASAVVVYLPAGEGSRQLMRAAMRGSPGDPPSFCDEMQALNYAAQRDFTVVPLALRKQHSGMLILGGAALGPDGTLPLVELLAVQVATTFALIGEREQSTRGAMKDPISSAYTFAYFVDVAGREIDKARRYGRRFALATIGVESDPEATSAQSDMSVETAERVLGVVRDTDVLARVDEREFYLLLPETGGTGAHTCRRRIMQRLVGKGGDRQRTLPIDVTIGVATYPHDGMDLSQLLRVAKHRADVARNSIVRRLRLDRMPLGELVDSLFWDTSELPHGIGIESPRSIELPAVDMMGLATTALNEALRGGWAQIVTTQRPGVSVGAALRSALSRDAEEARIHSVDLTHVPGCADIEALTIIAEQGAYALVGRVDRGVVRAIHTADPVFADLLTQRLGEAGGVRLVD